MDSVVGEACDELHLIDRFCNGCSQWRMTYVMGLFCNEQSAMGGAYDHWNDGLYVTDGAGDDVACDRHMI